MSKPEAQIERLIDKQLIVLTSSLRASTQVSISGRIGGGSGGRGAASDTNAVLTGCGFLSAQLKGEAEPRLRSGSNGIDRDCDKTTLEPPG